MSAVAVAAPPRPPRARRWVLGAMALLGALAAVGVWWTRPQLAVLWKERALPRGERPTVLLITLDGVRADRLGAYGAKVETPRLDALAAEGVLFEQAYTTAPSCLPAHASLLTGLRVSRHGALEELGYTLDAGVLTLAETFARAGYATAAVVASTVLDGSTGLRQGFETYADDFGEVGKRPGRSEREASDKIVERVKATLARPQDRPLLLWVHLTDALPPHTSKDAVAAAKYAGRPYDGEVAGLDARVGALVDAVRASRPQALVVITADHGIALGEHGEEGYGFFVYSATTRVPLILSMPGRLPATRVSKVASLVDVMPTLLDLVGLDPAAGVDGASLVPSMVGRAAEGGSPATGAVVENPGVRIKYGLSPVHALRSGPYLYVRAPRPELYDTAQDPGEKDEASSRLTRVRAKMEADFAALAPGAMPAEGQDVKDSLDVYNRYRSAVDIEASGNRVGAIVVYRTILSEVPGFSFARRKLAELLLRDGQLVEAEIVLRELVQRGEATENAYLNLALVRHRLKKPQETVDWLRRGLAAFPASVSLAHRLGRLELEAKRPAEALELMQKAARGEPLFLDARLGVAQALEALGRGPEARAEYEAVVSMAPTSDDAKEARAALER